MVSGGSISFSLTARNGTTVLATRNVSFFNFGSFSLYPNPSSNKLAIDLNPDLKFDLVLQGLDSKIKSEIFKYSGGQEIDISALPKGDYILQIIYEGKIIHQARFIVSK
ncbi:MAG: T9SS C-terminal target domain-containing protein [Cyclobacterium sp.]|nr:T9SS C-terminal target domain-containing protein [Cyclobacterium sp.]